MNNEVPELLGSRYQVGRLIAEGGMARVYRGTDAVLGRTVAVKILSARLASDPAFVARFEREAQSVASLNHPNLVGVYDIGADGDMHYIVMEYVEGSTLDAVIQAEAPLLPDRVAAIAGSICDGLAAAHAKGIVHRDIKPANVMIEPSGRVKVMDFGIAKTKTDGLTQVGSVLGTVRYLAPEQAQGDPVDARTDIYALGCVMYEMLTGRPPIEGESLVEIAGKLATYQPEPPSHLNPTVPKYLDRVVMTALAKDPARRYPDTGAMRLDLGDPVPGAGPAEASNPTLVQSRPDRTRVMPVPPASRSGGHRWLLVAGLLLVAWGAFALVRNLSAPEPPPTVAPPPPPTEPEPPPPPPPPPSPSPSPTESPSPEPAETEESNSALVQQLNAAAGGVREVLADAVAAGTASERAARNIAGEAEKVIAEAERDDLEDALADLGDARAEVQKYLEREELTPQVASAVHAQLDRMARALGA